MADYMGSDEEKIERIKEWFVENGLSTLIVIVLAIGGVVGWRVWQNYQHDTAAQASQVYETMMAALGGASADQARTAADTLIADYEGSTYADYAHLVLAKLAVQEQNLDAAAEQLQAVAEDPAVAELGYTARVRLTRVYLEQGKLDAAEKQISRTFPQAWQGRALELKGDIAQARGDHDAARDAYTTALDLMESGASRNRVQMKLDNLNG